MRAYVIQRLLLLAPTVLAIVLAAFLVIHLAPGDPVDLLYDFERRTVTAEQREQIRHDLGLDRPLLVQYAAYLRGVLRGDLGTSVVTKQAVVAEIRGNAPATVHLALAGIAVTALIGIPAGMAAALRRNTWIDHTALTGAVIGLAAPNFWIGMLLIYLFGYTLGWLPIVGGDGNTSTIVRSLILPALTVGSAGAALLARMTRSSVLEVLRNDYVRTAWAKGLTASRVVWWHVMRNAAIPVVTALGLSLAGLLGGSVIVELVFSRRGLGWLLVGAINNRDFALLQGLVLIYGATLVLVNLVVDLLYGLLDPRVRYH